MKLIRFLALALLACAAIPAQAHLMPKQNGSMKIVDNSANFVISVPVSALEGVDDDGDGVLSPAEITKHNTSISQQFDRRFTVRADGIDGKQAMSWVLSPITDDPTASTDYVVVMHRVFFADTPQRPEITTDLFGTGPSERQITLRASRGDEGEQAEVAILTPSDNTHRYFQGGWSIFADFVATGVEHIWGGIDHLLFLLTIIVAGANWRYWLGVVTSFTIAHSITLTLSALDVLRIDAAIVEPGIALSIVLLALLNLFGGKWAWTSGTGARVAIVFACGLLHGFGFASAIGEIGLASGSKFATLAGFNVGIEVGQFLFVAAVLAIAWMLGRLGLKTIVAQLPKLASIAAALLGAVFFVQRIAGL